MRDWDAAVTLAATEAEEEEEEEEEEGGREVGGRDRLERKSCPK